jgi:hypothetical protein
VRSPRLDIQLKATARQLPDEVIPFDLDVGHYDALRSELLQVPRILVVVAVPADAADWVSATEQALTLRHCGYWLSLRGFAKSENTATVRVSLSRGSRFHVTEVQSIMARVGAGGFP